jgi:hypothetical protein
VVAPPPPVEDSIPHETAEFTVETVFDPEVFLAEVEGALATADSEETTIEVWDSLDVEASLTDHENVLQRAFDARKAKLDSLKAVELAGTP